VRRASPPEPLINHAGVWKESNAFYKLKAKRQALNNKTNLANNLQSLRFSLGRNLKNFLARCLEHNFGGEKNQNPPKELKPYRK